MKKAILGVFTAVMVLSAGTMNVCAAGCGTRHHHADTVCENADRICYYVDADEDDICDNCSACHKSCTEGTDFLDEDGDGICDNCNAYHRCGGDGDGSVCHSPAAGQSISGRSRHGSHRRHGCHR
ncbi:MAG: hypothetical protein K2K63_15550 [Acetatifactor sp.]|nr:hypothetical protein [Acetatifactor sp.]